MFGKIWVFSLLIGLIYCAPTVAYTSYWGDWDGEIQDYTASDLEGLNEQFNYRSVSSVELSCQVLDYQTILCDDNKTYKFEEAQEEDYRYPGK